MKKILVVDNTFDPPHGSPEIRRLLEEGAKELGEAEVVSVRAPEERIPEDLSAYAGVVLSGSKTRIYENAPWIDKEMAAIRRLFELKIPTLGICYGEQLIARALGGEKLAGVAAVGEHGWQEIEVTGESEILRGLPKTFHSFEFHSDEVYRPPEGFRVTASSRDCPVQAFEGEKAPMWGLQFHPERGKDKGTGGLDRWAAAHPDEKILNRDRADELYDPHVARTIFRNFLRKVWSGR